jgi:hypothetical protein
VPLLSLIARALFLNRILRGGRRGRTVSPWGYGRRSRGRGGFFGPFPYYSTRTRRGSRVSVSGCCLPIPLTLVTGGALLLRAARR